MRSGGGCDGTRGLRGLAAALLRASSSGALLLLLGSGLHGLA